MSPLIAISLLFTFSSCSIANEQVNYIMPKSLVDYANEKKCLQLTDFYEKRQDSKNPPYVYAPLTYSSDSLRDNSISYVFDSAAFWCLRKNKVSLIIKINHMSKVEKGGMASCTNEIPNIPEWFVNGLSYKKEIDFSDVVSIRIKDKKELTMKVRAPSIYSLDEGSGVAFYCYNNDWYQVVFD